MRTKGLNLLDNIHSLDNLQNIEWKRMMDSAILVRRRRAFHQATRSSLCRGKTGSHLYLDRRLPWTGSLVLYAWAGSSHQRTLPHKLTCHRYRCRHCPACKTTYPLPLYWPVPAPDSKTANWAPWVGEGGVLFNTAWFNSLAGRSGSQPAKERGMSRKLNCGFGLWNLHLGTWSWDMVGWLSENPNLTDYFRLSNFTPVIQFCTCVK